ncbi:S-formylglutathione hydrolase [Hyphobacterium sp. HN65]|uniref:S-formylglutathione hydrolase n=1 Tax=Hyphobacterium lacteum TaxID=3116575 RepID=A0ABU7LTY7_9PROT|nr:S-formylglutathione hydrolase [Hyphobacterium sp. HN65]MEE2527362.1 S-formylglutathione hydrolase [Hyphobacterium sp. HN65]
MTPVSTFKSFDGTLSVHDHDSAVTGTVMRFAVFVPPQAENGPVPVLWYLSGLTCNWSNVMEKGNLQQAVARHGVMVVAPDTSPRGEGVPDDDAYDLGQGAGFYLTATQAPWSQHFAMDRYITGELPDIIAANFPADMSRQGIFGHSMGGHGALTLHLKHPGTYQTCSAFAPIVAPMQVPWGEKAFSAYLGEDRAAWAQYDACELVRQQASSAHILIDQGMADNFLEDQLKPDLFEAACAEAGQKLTLRRQAGYDHSYYFISTFMDDHIAHHAKALG